MRGREREREREAEREAGSMQGARPGTGSRVSRITPWAEGSAKPLSHPGCLGFPILITFKLTRSKIFDVKYDVEKAIMLSILVPNYRLVAH